MSFSGGNGITLMSKITLTWINHLLHGRKLLYIIVTNMCSSVIFFVLSLRQTNSADQCRAAAAAGFDERVAKEAACSLVFCAQG